MSKKKPSTMYIKHPGAEEQTRPLPDLGFDDEEEVTEVTKMRESLDEVLAASERRLTSLRNKVARLRDVAKRRDSAPKMLAALSDKPVASK